MTIADYTVRLEAFEGPLDLLLFLIRRAEVEVTDIPIAVITEQYLKYIEQMGAEDAGRIDIERAGEFLVMAATLMEIKSRMLAPPSRPSAEGGDAVEGDKGQGPDPRAELVQQLLEYKRFRDASDALNKSKTDWENRFPAGRALAGKPDIEEMAAKAEGQDGPVDMDDVQLIDLVEAFAKIIETVDMSRVGEHRVVMDDTPVEIHAEDIVDRLTRLREEALAAGRTDGGEIEFAGVFEGRTRSEAIGLFLAVLELVKQQRLHVRQEEGDASGKRILLKLAAVEEVRSEGGGQAGAEAIAAS